MNQPLSRIVTQDTKPGYVYQLKQGATALTEAWDANLLTSHNHFMLGQVTEWLYHDLAGIAADRSAPGFKHSLIRPQPVPGLAWVEASYESLHGPIAVRWEHADARFTLRVTVPPNTTATVYMPSREGAAITESDGPVERSSGVQFLRREGDRALYRITSGSYVFAAER